MIPPKSLALGLLIFASSFLSALAEKPLGLKLPTYNRYIFSSTPEKFYMYTTRNFEGVASKPWTAGQYGFVRNLKRTSEGILGTRFHEGIDIRPVKRDSGGRPQDYIMSIADGKVVHVNSSAGGSNYGRYIVVEHDWGTGRFFSLYAHLDKAGVTVGKKVKAGEIIGKMGYTGAGINRERAHLHLELNVMANRGFDHWHAHYFGSKNVHGSYNGLNMNGLDISQIFIKNNTNKRLTITQFIKTVPVYFKVTVPRKRAVDIADRYPWIKKGNHSASSPSWEISYAATGFPLAVAPSMRRVTKPIVSYVKSSKTNHSYKTKGLISGTGSSATVTSLGQRTIALISGDFPKKPKVIKPKIDPADIPRAIPVQ